MSLLLDALQRASDEKEKLAAASSENQSQVSAASAADSDTNHTAAPLPTLEFPELSDLTFEQAAADTKAQPEVPDTRHDTKPVSPAPSALALEAAPSPAVVPLEIESQPQLEPMTAPVPAVDSASGQRSKYAPPLASAAEDHLAPSASPRAEPRTPPVEPRPAVQAGATISPKIAREILLSSAPSPRRLDRRVVLLAIALLVLVATAGALYWLKTGDSDIAAAPAAPFNPNAPAAEPVAAPPAVAEAAPASDAGTTASAPQVAAAPVAALAPLQHSAPTTVRPRHDRPPPAGKRLFTAVPGSTSQLDLGYAALKADRLEEAAAHYQSALASNRSETDALLGLAYIARREGAINQARAYYAEVLRHNPGHPDATAGLLAIASEGNLQGSTSQAGEVARKNPESAIAMATLGNLLAKEGRIAEAQQAFFRAATLEPANALYTFNLAVALDRLHKPAQALIYYRKALALTGEDDGPASFSRDAAQQRIAQLDQVAASLPAPITNVR